MNERLFELKTWFLSCSYPLAIIEKAFFNAELHGLAPKNTLFSLHQYILAILIRKVPPLQID